MHSIFEKAEELKVAGIPSALCIVTETKGSTPRKAGSKMIVYRDGKIFGTIGGGSIEKDVISKAIELIGGGKPGKFNFNLATDLGMHCGGSMEVYIEPICQLHQLFIFGGGHIGKALATFAGELGFNVNVIDPRPEIFTGDYAACNIIQKDYFEAIESIEFDKFSYIVIVTPKHLYDEDILARVVRKPHAYVGMIGSSRKIELLRKRFLDENLLTNEEMDSVDMPIGVPFKVETPQEIAISILAKLIDVKNSF